MRERCPMAGRCRNLLRPMDASKWSSCCVSLASREACNSVLDEFDAAYCVAVGEQGDWLTMGDALHRINVGEPVELARPLRELLPVES